MIIYKTTNTINGRIYVGQDSNNDPEYFGSGKILKLAFKKYGKENFKKEILEYCNSKEELNEREVYWIKIIKKEVKEKMYNITDGGIGGDTLSNNPNLSEIKNKLKNKVPWNKGKKLIPLSEEHKKNQSKSLKKFYEDNSHHSKGKDPWNKGKKTGQIPWNKKRKVTFKIGLGGNFYVTCDIKEPLICIAERIKKSPNSIYFNSKYNVWAIRCKSKKHKELLRKIYKK